MDSINIKGFKNSVKLNVKHTAFNLLLGKEWKVVALLLMSLVWSSK